MPWFPEDANGDVLRDMFARGDPLEQPRDIEFDLIFAIVDNANQFLATVRHLGFKAACYHWEKKGVWNVCVMVFMIPEHAAITRMEDRLRPLGQEFMGDFDGWSSFVMN